MASCVELGVAFVDDVNLHPDLLPCLILKVST